LDFDLDFDVDLGADIAADPDEGLIFAAAPQKKWPRNRGHNFERGVMEGIKKGCAGGRSAERSSQDEVSANGAFENNGEE